MRKEKQTDRQTDRQNIPNHEVKTSRSANLRLPRGNQRKYVEGGYLQKFDLVTT